MNNTMTHVSDKECEAIATQFAKSRGKKGFTENEFVELLDHIQLIRIQNEMVDLIISGEFLLDWNGSDILVSTTKHTTP